MRTLWTILTFMVFIGCSRYSGSYSLVGIDIWKAVEEERLDLIREYVARGGDLETGHRTRGKTPLFHAFDLGRRESFEELLRLGASPNTICHHGRTTTSLLHWAAAFPDPYWLRRLLESGGDPQLKLVRGRRFDLPLSGALSSTSTPENVRLLVEYGADVNAIVEGPDRLAITKAASSGIPDRWVIVLFLLEHGADFERGSAPGGSSQSLMEVMSHRVRHQAVFERESGFKEVVQWLKDRGADPTRARWNGQRWVYDG